MKTFPSPHKAGRPVYRGTPSSNVSYSGTDVRATAFANGQTYELGNLYTISYSTFRDIIPIRGLGQAAALGHARGYRTIAGTMVFTQFNKDALFDMISVDQHDRNASGWYPILPDQIPSFNLILHFGLETERRVYAPVYQDTGGQGQVNNPSSYLGSSPIPVGSILVLYKVVMAGQGSTISVDDTMTEGIFNYHALGISPLRDNLDDALAEGTYQGDTEMGLIMSLKSYSKFLSDAVKPVTDLFTKVPSITPTPTTTPVPGTPVSGEYTQINPGETLYDMNNNPYQNPNVSASNTTQTVATTLFDKLVLTAKKSVPILKNVVLNVADRVVEDVVTREVNVINGKISDVLGMPVDVVGILEGAKTWLETPIVQAPEVGTPSSIVYPPTGAGVYLARIHGANIAVAPETMSQRDVITYISDQRGVDIIDRKGNVFTKAPPTKPLGNVTLFNGSIHQIYAFGNVTDSQ